MSSSARLDKQSNIVSLDDRRAVVASRSQFKSRQSASYQSGTDVPSHNQSPEADGRAEIHFKLIDFLQKLDFQASLEIDDLNWIRSQFPPRVRDQTVATVKKILCQEFGKNRVWRLGLLFEVQHRHVEPLIASLLRVQFYTNQILLPEYNVFGERVDQGGVSVTWGVGRNLKEAKQERIKKRHQKMLR